MDTEFEEGLRGVLERPICFSCATVLLGLIPAAAPGREGQLHLGKVHYVPRSQDCSWSLGFLEAMCQIRRRTIGRPRWTKRLPIMVQKHILDYWCIWI